MKRLFATVLTGLALALSSCETETKSEYINPKAEQSSLDL